MFSEAGKLEESLQKQQVLECLTRVFRALVSISPVTGDRPTIFMIGVKPLQVPSSTDTNLIFKLLDEYNTNQTESALLRAVEIAKDLAQRVRIFEIFFLADDYIKFDKRWGKIACTPQGILGYTIYQRNIDALRAQAINYVEMDLLFDGPKIDAKLENCRADFDICKRHIGSLEAAEKNAKTSDHRQKVAIWLSAAAVLASLLVFFVPDSRLKEIVEKWLFPPKNQTVLPTPYSSSPVR